MITNKLKINDSKTEFIVFRSPQLKCDLSLCELINKNESHVSTRLGTDHHQLIMPPISKDCSNTFLER